MRTLQRNASVVVLSAAVSLSGMIVGCGQQGSYVAPPAPEVDVALPIRRAVTSYIEYTATTKAEETVDLRARVKGFLKERHFNEKAPVKKDQLLFVIDEEPYQVAFDMAKAKLAEAEAALKKAEQSKAKEVATAQLALDLASLNLAKIDERRSRTLVERNAATKEELDQSQANLSKAEAQVEADRANLEQVTADYQTNILSAKASMEAARSDARNAEINLGYCRITSPFDGRISRRLYDVGNLVGDGQATVLATVYKDNPIYSYANVSERDLLKFRKMAREGKHRNFEKGDEIALDLGLSNEDGFPHNGTLDYSDPSVDPASGTILCRGVFANPDRIIVPGLFARLRVVLEEKPDALLVPEAALQADQKGKYLLIVEPKENKVVRLEVKVGTQDGRLREIEKSPDSERFLKADDLVIVNGLQKARPDSKVKPNRIDLTKSAIAAVSKTP